MATEADHIALANKNHAVLMHLLEDVEKFPEWVTVAAFYKALQIVEAVFVHKYGRSCHGHQRRLESLKARGHKDLHRHYRVLWGASCVARYLYDTTTGKPYSCFTDYLSPDQVKEAIVKRRLFGLECCAVTLLSDKGRQELARLPW
jgi:deoxyribodipyrimidine photolyase